MLLLGFLNISWAQDIQVTQEQGSILLKEDGQVVPLIQDGNSRAPSLSPDKKKVVYVKKVFGQDQIWIVDLKDRKPRLLASEKSVAPGNAPGKTLLGTLCSDQLSFSPDGGTLYFLALAYETSCAVYGVDINTGDEKFVTDGNSLHVAMNGQYAGSLVVEKHKYFLGGPAYNFAWLVQPDGTEVGPVGESAADVNWDLIDPEPIGD
jgi:Tol biopolymer transport system component